MTTAPKASAKKATAVPDTSPSPHASRSAFPNPHSELLEMQQTVGNHAVSQLIEAQVTRLAQDGIPPIVEEVLGSGRGQPLDPGIRKEMEANFGEAFGSVRVRTDSQVSQAARKLNAVAYTSGENIALRDQGLDFKSEQGRQLLAHELAHVVQQRKAGDSRSAEVNEPGDRFEMDADRAAHAVTAGNQAQITVDGPPPMMQRSPDTPKVNSSHEKLPPPESDKELETLTTVEIERRARLLNSPYRQENAPRLLRLLHAWESKQEVTALSRSNDPLVGLAPETIFGDRNILAVDAAQQSPKKKRVRRKRRSTNEPLRVEHVDFDEGDVIEGQRTEPDEVSEVAHDAVKDISGSFTPPSEAAEAIASGLHVVGGGVEQVGEETLGLGLAGLALEVAGLYIDYVHTIVGTAAQRTEGGELEGTVWTLLGAAELDRKGLLGGNAKNFYAQALRQRRLESKSTTFEHEGGALGQIQREKGHEEGINKAVEQLVKVMERAEQKYNEIRLEMTLGPNPQGGELGRSALLSRRLAYEKAGLTFDDPEKGVQFLRHLALERILKELPRLGELRKELRK